ncbi:MAG TPA: methyltransferase domain-containing protein [Luteimonas sp.]|nr:methyltransferase domain-containing protein [Luteimonas sp.]
MKQANPDKAQYQSFPDAAGDSRTLDKLKALRLPALDGRSFLDVGCNEGFFCGFARFQGATRSVGIDHSQLFIERARARFPDCEFHQQGWDRLPEGPFDVILLASALHYADDQAALVHALVDRLSPDGTLVLELGIASSRRAEWTRVKRGIDEREFPSMPMLREILAGHAWKWMGPSIPQDGDPVPRHVVHVSRRRPVAYLLMQPPGYGKSSLASGLFPRAAVPVVSGDQEIGLAAKGKGAASAALREAIAEDYSPFQLDRTIERIFERGLGADLVALWVAQAGEGDIALDAYVPASRHREIERLLEARGYLPVRLEWDRVGHAPLPDAPMAQAAEAFYLSLLGDVGAPAAAGASAARWEPAGFIDELGLEDGRLVVRGWAIDASGALPREINARLGRRTLGVERVERQLRPDVQRHLGLPHALVGYRAVVDATGVRGPADLDGLKISARGGPAFQLAGPVAAIFRGAER